MGLLKIKLGEFIVDNNRKNRDGRLGIDKVRGITKDKLIRETSKALVDDKTARKFYVVAPQGFVYNPRTDRMGGVCATAMNDTDEELLFSFNNVAFDMLPSAHTSLLPRYLYMYFNRSEFDRYVRFHSWGSATQLFTIDDMKAVEILLPPIEVQRKYVAIFESILANQRSYELGLRDLKISCDALVEKLMREVPSEPIGSLIELSDERNRMGRFDSGAVRGISTAKQFIETVAKLDGVNLGSYRIVKPDEYAYVADTSRRGDKISLAFNDTNETYITSAINTVFRVSEGGRRKLLPGYLMLFFGREEFDRYTRFCSWGSARETFNWDEMCNVRIPLPDISVQRYAVSLYQTWRAHSEINERLKSQLKEISPVLIRGSIEEASS